MLLSEQGILCVWRSAMRRVWRTRMFYTTESKKSGEITFAFQILFYILHISALSRHYKTLMFTSALNTSHLISCIWFLQAEPPPEITWLKDDEPLSPWIQVINTEGMSQLCIPSSKRSDSAIYTIKAKNSVGQAVFDIEVRVTGKAKKSVDCIGLIGLHWLKIWACGLWIITLFSK